MEKLPFQNILEAASPAEFFALRDSQEVPEPHKFPTTQEATAHLLLLKAFDRLYQNKTSHIPLEKDRAIPWKVFVTNAVRRFIIFLSAFKSLRSLKNLYQPDPEDTEDTVKDHPDEDFEYFAEFEAIHRRKPNALHNLLPPLDVVMVWHAFLLNPKAFYDNCMRNGLQDLALTSFPLDKISKAIDWETFEYSPNEKQQEGFHELMRGLGTTMDFEVDLKLLVNEKVDVFCPLCYELLTTVPYTDHLAHGFTDKDFVADTPEKCACQCNGFENSIITHDNLRKRQLIADCFLSKARLPHVYRYYSSVLQGLAYDLKNISTIDYAVKQYLRGFVSNKIVEEKQISLQGILLQLSKTPVSLTKHRRILQNTKYIMRNYPQMNLIHATIPLSTSDVQISEDLVGCVLRQQKFVDKMNKIGWLFSPILSETLSETSIRYIRFISMLNTTPGVLVPTLDIDLMWHTHLLSPYDYLEHCRKAGKKVVDHDDKIEEGQLTNRFEVTSKLYKSRYGKEYCLCFCWFCVSARNNCKSKIKRLFRLKEDIDLNEIKSTLGEKNEYHEDKGAGLTHISSHNAITIPRLNRMQTLTMERRYKPDNKGRVYPWRDDPFYYYGPTALYVLPFYAPIGAGEGNYWGSGGCCTVGDYGGANCSGGGGGGNCGSNTGTAACGSTGGSACAGGSGGCGGGGGGCGGGCGGGGCGGGGN